MSIQELREQRAAKAKAVSELVNKKDWNKDTDQPVYDTLMKEYDELTEKVDRIEALNEKIAKNSMNEKIIQTLEKRGKDNKTVGDSLHAKWLRNGFDKFSPDDMAEYRQIQNTMSVGTPSQGGYTVQTEIARTVLDALLAYGGMRAVSTVLQTSMGNPISFPASDGRGETGEIVAENTAAAAQDLAFSTIPLTVQKFSSKVVKIPFELLQDSNVDVEAFVRGRLVTRLGRIQNTKFTLGSGTAEPFGIVTAASTGYTAANATSQVTNVIYNSLVELIHSVDPAYRAANCKFMMNDKTLKVIRQITDTQNRPIFVPGYTMGIAGAALSAPDVIMGYGVQINQDMAQMAASAKSIAFGDFSYYYIRDVMALEMFRFADSPYITAGQIGFLAWMRSGGNLIDVGGAVKLFVNAAS